MGNQKQAKASRLNRTYQVSLKKIIAIAVIAVVAISGFLLVENQIETHRAWAAEIIQAQEFRNHIENARAFAYLNDSNSESYQRSRDELTYASESIEKIADLDKVHSSELFRISVFLENLRGANDTQKAQLIAAVPGLSYNMRMIGEKVLAAYGTFDKDTVINTKEGPSFWYFGAPPPNEAILQEAYDLATEAYNNLH
jgi:hypothetical protein